jgi:protein ImuB
LAAIAPSGPSAGGGDLRMIATPRMLVLWVPDWPAVAAGARPDHPAVVVKANRVVAATPAARADGVTIGLRRREAQTRCPAVEVIAHDPDRDARAFEPVVAAVVEHITPRVEVVAPGQLAFPTRGPSRYHGGDAALADLVLAAVVDVIGVAPGPTVGVADGRFGALLAAMAARPESTDETLTAPTEPTEPQLVEPGASAAHLAPLPVETLALVGIDEATIEVLRRLGLRTLGAVAALPASDLAGRFGVMGATAHRLANGLDGQPPMPGLPPPDRTIRAELDPPAELVETVAFVARSLADDLTGRLDDDGLTCTTLLVVVETDHGERRERRWRGDGLGGAGTLTAAAMVDRVRWQLEGWARADALTAGVTLLELVAEEVVATRGRQLGFWGRSPQADDAVVRAVARVAGLLGVDAVLVPVWRGGRDPAEQFELVPAATIDLTADRPLAPGRSPPPWSGAPPVPAPATVFTDPIAAELVDAHDRPVQVGGVGVLSAPPARYRQAGSRQGWVDIDTWAGPWTIEERWWSPRRRRRANLQLIDATGTAVLLTVEAGQWWLAAVYD